MTEKEKFANASNFSQFAIKWPKSAFILAIIVYPILPIIYLLTVIIQTILEIDWKDMINEWKTFHKGIRNLITYIKM